MPTDSNHENHLGPETEILRKRRKHARVDQEQPTMGLALSGGGVRSATFCFGLLRALAANGLLRRFDYLSTVSGGGYIGTALGRLYRDEPANDTTSSDQPATPSIAEKVERGIAAEDTLLLWWLRSNGRYLIPAGMRDIMQASASVLRGFIATQFEIGLLMLLLGCAITLPWLCNVAYPMQIDDAKTGFLMQLAGPWLWFLVLPLALGSLQIFAYWFCPRGELSSSERTWRAILQLAVLALLAFCFSQVVIYADNIWEKIATDSDSTPVTHGRFGTYRYFDASLLLAGLLLSAIGALLLRLWRDFLWPRFANTPPDSDTERASLTHQLANTLWLFFILSGIALIDSMAYWLASTVNLNDYRWAVSATGGLTLVVTVLRAVLPTLTQLWQQKHNGGSYLETIASGFGVLLVIFMQILWTGFLYVTWFAVRPSGVLPIADGILVALIAAFIVGTRRNFNQLNLASMHHFYRNRLARVYVGVGNVATPGTKGMHRFHESPLHAANRQNIAGIAPLRSVMRRDDIDLADYAPHTYGGPVHLINCCINQSVDDRTGNYNADRKGIALTLSALGIETGTNLPHPIAADEPAAQTLFVHLRRWLHGPAHIGNNQQPQATNRATLGKLSRWVAVSGAAVGSGMGSFTSPGIASLVFLSGMRLGLWSPTLLDFGKAPKTAFALFARWLPKTSATLAELFGHFPGLRSDNWYISDGGHFDNTGVYALLKRRVDCIVLADCGADPNYLFRDIENLVRKAEIDYGVKIEFLDPADLTTEDSTSSTLYGTPETIGPAPDASYLMVARIAYPALDCGATHLRHAKYGTLLVVKPRRLQQLPLDLVGYADRHPDFPQQSTTHQFFNEEQWESYHQLGRHLGQEVTALRIEQAMHFTAQPIKATLGTVKSEAVTQQENQNNLRRNRIQTAVSASLGAGVSFSLILGLWQGFDQWRIETRDNSRQVLEKLANAQREIEQKDFDHVTLSTLQDIETLAAASTGDSKVQERLRTLNDLIGAWCDNNENPTTTQPDSNVDQAKQKLRHAKCTAITTLSMRTHNNGESIAYWQIRKSEDNSPTQAASATVVQQKISGNTDHANTLQQTNSCAEHPLYAQIYDEDRRNSANQLLRRWQDILAVRPMGTENVTRSARNQGRTPPLIWLRPALIYHAGVTVECKTKIAEQLRRLNPENGIAERDLSGDSNDKAIELWLPPTPKQQARSGM